MNWYLTVLKKYAVFSGRARRSEFWYFVLFNFIVSIIFGLIGKAVDFTSLRWIYFAAVLLPYIGVGVRRMHDINKSGWYSLIPIYNIVLACQDGTPGDNEYGENPKGILAFGADDYRKPFDINPSV